MHTMESVHILFYSQIIKKSWLKKFESVKFNVNLCAIRNFNTSQLAKQCEMWQEKFFNQSPEQHRQNPMYSFHISQTMSFLFSLYAELTIIFFCNPRIRVEALRHFWCCCHVLQIQLPIDSIRKPSKWLKSTLKQIVENN